MFPYPSNSDMDHGIFNVRSVVNACGCTRSVHLHRKRVCSESGLWEKNLLPHRGIEPASAVCRSHALPAELRASPPVHSWTTFSDKKVQYRDFRFLGRNMPMRKTYTAHTHHYGVVPKGLSTFLGSLYKEVAKTTSGTLVYRFERQTARKRFLP